MITPKKIEISIDNVKNNIIKPKIYSSKISFLEYKNLPMNAKFFHKNIFYTKKEIFDKLSDKYKNIYNNLFLFDEKSRIYININYKLIKNSFLVNRIISFLLYLYYWIQQDMVITSISNTTKFDDRNNPWWPEYCIKSKEENEVPIGSLVYIFISIQVISLIGYIGCLQVFNIIIYKHDSPITLDNDIMNHLVKFYKCDQFSYDHNSNYILKKKFKEIKGKTKKTLRLTSFSRFCFIFSIYIIEKFIENTYILTNNKLTNNKELRCVHNFTYYNKYYESNLYTLSAQYVPFFSDIIPFNLVIPPFIIIYYIGIAAFQKSLNESIFNCWFLILIPQIIYIIGIITNNPNELIYLPQFFLFNNFKFDFSNPKFWTDINYIISYLSFISQLFIDYIFKINF